MVSRSTRRPHAFAFFAFTRSAISRMSDILGSGCIGLQARSSDNTIVANGLFKYDTSQYSAGLPLTRIY